MILLFFGILWAVVCGIMANNRNRHVVLGVISGFFFGLLTVIYYALAGKKAE